MKTNILGNLVNVIMNFILIFGMGPIPAMGVAGAAIGTVISTIFSLCWTIYLMKKDHLLEGGSFIPDQAYFKKVTPIFLSVFSEQGFERIGMVLFTRMAASLGTIPFAVHSICMNIADIYWDYIIGFGKASMVTAGQSIGKNRKPNGTRLNGQALNGPLSVPSSHSPSLPFSEKKSFPSILPIPKRLL